MATCNGCTVFYGVIPSDSGNCERCEADPPQLCYLCDAPGTWTGEDAYYCAEHDEPGTWNGEDAYPCECRPRAPRERMNEINRMGY